MNVDPRSSFSHRDNPSCIDHMVHRALSTREEELQRTVEFVLDDCFFTVGQIVGTRKTVEYDAVIWWHDHYRERFLAAMRRFGERWLQDRTQVKAVALMLAERAVRYAGDRDAIDRAAAQRAAADVERYCAAHSRRAARARRGESETELARIAGYWCVPV